MSEFTRVSLESGATEWPLELGRIAEDFKSIGIMLNPDDYKGLKSEEAVRKISIDAKFQKPDIDPDTVIAITVGWMEKSITWRPGDE